MEAVAFLRVVALKKGGLKAAEFRLRPGEKGLSLFASTDQPNPAEVIEAVRSAGKQGDLAAALIPASRIQALGLVVSRTEGGSPVPAVNTIHYEARLPFFRRLLVLFRGLALHEYFNANYSERLYEAAQLVSPEE
jgi:hypothetical protein